MVVCTRGRVVRGADVWERENVRALSTTGGRHQRRRRQRNCRSVVAINAASDRDNAPPAHLSLWTRRRNTWLSAHTTMTTRPQSSVTSTFVRTEIVNGVDAVMLLLISQTRRTVDIVQQCHVLQLEVSYFASGHSLVTFRLSGNGNKLRSLSAPSWLCLRRMRLCKRISGVGGHTVLTVQSRRPIVPHSSLGQISIKF